MDSFSSPSSGSSSQMSTEDFMSQLKTQLAQAYAEEFLEVLQKVSYEYRVLTGCECGYAYRYGGTHTGYGKRGSGTFGSFGYAVGTALTVRGKCFEKCITKPGSSLSGSESSCISRGKTNISNLIFPIPSLQHPLLFPPSSTVYHTVYHQSHSTTAIAKQHIRHHLPSNNTFYPNLDITYFELPIGQIHEYVFQALDESGKPHCLGGDYFEIDLFGNRWKSQPPIKDLGNGTYYFSLQIHLDFAGDYNLTIILLFKHYEGLKFSPQRFTIDKQVRKIQLKFFKSMAELQ
ncbi:hypothetical protein TEA_000992 [Camellia sinensis var. sinensis]|uniref:Tim10-like domain-containing protein n=1 Tax=Camellia sinensis var. sinensis TaxID=542762 RepID=A0A4S4EW81_CAMSN|nr:hypothetical protein TEA_000992 [Camellia sinensis var. sinensis]